MQFQFHQLVVIIFLFSAMKSSLTTKEKQRCPQQQSCGSLSIPYPFGTKTSGCYFDETFLITCNQTDNSPYLPNTNIPVLNISISGHELRIEGSVAYECQFTGGKPDSDIILLETLSNFPISSKRNKFTAVGCDTLGMISGSRGRNYSTSCTSNCGQIQDVINGSCTGSGCCQISIPNEIWDYGLGVGSVFNHTKSLIYDNSSCSYAFVADDSYNFSISDLKNLQNRKTYPLVLDWYIVNQTCEEARKFGDKYACQENSECANSTNGTGYRCSCKQGFEGNPYHPDGCIDINECYTSKPCHMTCHNIPGSYRCSCPFGYRGDGRKNGTGCNLGDAVTLGISSAFGPLLLLIIAWGFHKIIKKTIDNKRKERFFKRNGGLLLQQQICSTEVSVEKVKLFNSEELEKATDHFRANRILGQGGQGTVYKGMLDDGKIVAVKKSKLDNNEEGTISEFINEVVILSQINHRNVVKLLGCCLESEIPLLLYEFIPNGTLFQYIHDQQNEEFPLTWEVRLRIALEIGRALSYLHSAASFPIYHRDIKSSNILLDEKYRAKIADFGISRLVNIEQTHLTTLVKGTFGYLDPEYFQSSQFTEKSDVYSFGVVMVELLTGQKPISRTRSEDGEESRSLATYFLLCMEQNLLFDIVDPRLIDEEGGSQYQIIKVAHLAKRCLNLNGRHRPIMREVAMELEEIQNSAKTFVNM